MADTHEIAIIDIGSNTVRLMLNGKKKLITTRLAEGLAFSGVLCEESIKRSIDAITQFRDEARSFGATVYAYATSAVRDADNRAEFLRRVREECNIYVDVLTGEREAEYAYLGATGGEGGLMDVGGGSCQLISGGFALSFPMGCVRGKDVAFGSTLAELKDSLAETCRKLFMFPRILIRDWTGVGGTITTLCALKLGLTAYDPSLVTGSILTNQDVSSLIQTLYSMGDSRREHPLLYERHDVILYGAMIVELLMQGMAVQQLRISDADGMEGYYSAVQTGQLTVSD